MSLLKELELSPAPSQKERRDLRLHDIGREQMQGSSTDAKKKRHSEDPRDNPIEPPPNGTASDNPEMPIATPDPQRPPSYEGPKGGSKKRT